MMRKYSIIEGWGGLTLGEENSGIDGGTVLIGVDEVCLGVQWG